MRGPGRPDIVNAGSGESGYSEALSHDRQIEDGIKGSVHCEVNNFYPEAVKIRWVKYSKS
ncbi:unnamed protein product, partial [Staurois parvus]